MQRTSHLKLRLGALILVSWTDSVPAETTAEVSLDADGGSRFYENGDLKDLGPKVTYHGQGGGQKFRHTGPDDPVSAFSGARSYYVEVGPSPSGCTAKNCNDRSELRLLRNWHMEDGPLYFTFALYVPSPYSKQVGWLMPTQWWQTSPENPPLFFTLNSEQLSLVRRFDPNEGENLRQILYLERPFAFDTWHYFMLKVDFGLNQNGSLALWKMDLSTGLWEQKLNIAAFTIGWKHKFARDRRGRLVPADGRNLTWKVGTYRSPAPVTTKLYLDSLRFTDSFEKITNGLSLGFHRNLVSLDFEEEDWVATDSSERYNHGYTTENDGAVIGARHVSKCRNGGMCVELDGLDDYVRVPAREPWFDTENFLTLATFFSTVRELPPQGLLSLDYERFKAALVLQSPTQLQFSVRHPDSSVSQVTVQMPYRLDDGVFRHVLGTYNRFASDGHHLKLYLDGQLIATAAARNLPIERPRGYLYGGRLGNGFFHGRLDQIAMFNYALTEQQVRDYLARLLPAVGSADEELPAKQESAP